MSIGRCDSGVYYITHMKQLRTLIFITVLALLFIQCNIVPAKRDNNNAVGLWVGTTFNGELSDWVLGIDLKHLNSKNTVWDLNSGLNTVWNLYSGFYLGDLNLGNNSGMSIAVGYHLLTDDLVSKTNGNTGQIYIGPNLDFRYLKNKGKTYKHSVNLGATLGALMLFPAYKSFPESDISIETTVYGLTSIKDKTVKEDATGRILYNVYLF